MKYMGSKRSLLHAGLGNIILFELEKCYRFVDLMCGSASVSWFVAQNCNVSVLAFDLQLYAAVLASSVISRNYSVDSDQLIQTWINPVQHYVVQAERFQNFRDFQSKNNWRIDEVYEARELCNQFNDIGLIWTAYGGHYFSPYQALVLDSLLHFIPREEPLLSICLAAVISTASRAAASPGHTAQPFQPTQSALRHIVEAWTRDPFRLCRKAVIEICALHANKTGLASVSDAAAATQHLMSKDLVFVDLPYTGVQYSRFYHVLETIARGKVGNIAGIGRYPDKSERPQSDFSNKSQSINALEQLLKTIYYRGCSAIFTFPNHLCSNGLSGQIIAEIASEYFRVTSLLNASNFSTLGGNTIGRQARKRADELILLLHPR